jgi:hypothetical protein
MRIPWRTLLLWLVPLAAFGWLAVAGHAASNDPAMTVAGSLLGGGTVGARFVPRAGHGLRSTTVSVPADAGRARFHGGWSGRCSGYGGAVTAFFHQRVKIADDRTFTGKRPLESTSAEGAFGVSGRLDAAGSAEAAGRAVFTFINGDTRHECDTKDVSYQLRTSVSRLRRPG